MASCPDTNIDLNIDLIIYFPAHTLFLFLVPASPLPNCHKHLVITNNINCCFKFVFPSLSVL